MRVASLLGLSACATAGSFQTAHTVGPGGWEVGADGSALVLVDVRSDLPYMALPRATGRVGLSERTELGGSVGLDGIKLGPRVQLTDTSDEGPIVTVGLVGKVLPLPGPEGTGVLFGSEESVYLGVPVQQSQLVVVARSAQDAGFVNGNQATLIWAGGAVGWSWSFDDTFRLMPEVGAMLPVVVLDGDGETTGLDSGVVQAGLGVAFGQRR